jgi:hypothetical protein
MSPDEALARFAGVDSRELPKKQAKKATGGSAKPPPVKGKQAKKKSVTGRGGASKGG